MFHLTESSRKKKYVTVDYQLSKKQFENNMNQFLPFCGVDVAPIEHSWPGRKGKDCGMSLIPPRLHLSPGQAERTSLYH